jgi:hypothetical protein
MRHTPPEFAEITPAMRERLEKFREEHAGDPIGNVGTQLLLEDENVKIWEMVLEPGEWSDLHHHEHVYYLAVSSGDLVAGIPPQGMGDPFIGKIPPQGNTVCVPKGGTEWAWNVGKQTYREILIELKKT